MYLRIFFVLASLLVFVSSQDTVVNVKEPVPQDVDQEDDDQSLTLDNDSNVEQVDGTPEDDDKGIEDNPDDNEPIDTNQDENDAIDEDAGAESEDGQMRNNLDGDTESQEENDDDQNTEEGQEAEEDQQEVNNTENNDDVDDDEGDNDDHTDADASDDGDVSNEDSTTDGDQGDANTVKEDELDESEENDDRLMEVCTVNYGECKESCDENVAELQGICGNAVEVCCIATKEMQEEWVKQDVECDVNYGHCQLSTSACAVDGEQWVLSADMCGGIDNRQCCRPGENIIEEWENDDEQCQQNMGQCQSQLTDCNGDINEDFQCGGPSTRVCCVPSAEIQEGWTQEDGQCESQWGTCQPDHQPCSNGYKYNDVDMCGGPSARRCCVPVMQTVLDWSSMNGEDAECTHSFGTCQSSSKVCKSGEVYPDACGGPDYRVCCEIGKPELTAWQEDDGTCDRLKGVCQHTDLTCEKWSTEGTCGGPAERKCCVSIKSVQEIKKNQRYQAIIVGFSSVGAIAMIVVAYMYLKRWRGSDTYKKVSGQKWYQSSEGGYHEEEVKLTSADGLMMSSEESSIMKEYDQLMDQGDQSSYA